MAKQAMEDVEFARGDKVLLNQGRGTFEGEVTKVNAKKRVATVKFVHGRKVRKFDALTRV